MLPDHIRRTRGRPDMYAKLVTKLVGDRTRRLGRRRGLKSDKGEWNGRRVLLQTMDALLQGAQFLVEPGHLLSCMLIGFPRTLRRFNVRLGLSLPAALPAALAPARCVRTNLRTCAALLQRALRELKPSLGEAVDITRLVDKEWLLACGLLKPLEYPLRHSHVRAGIV